MKYTVPPWTVATLLQSQLKTKVLISQTKIGTSSYTLFTTQILKLMELSAGTC